MPEEQLPRGRGTAKAAYSSVELPEAVVDVLTALRNYLQDKCEPPIYVSDRRFMKAVNLLQVAAFADGRDQARPLLRRCCAACFWHGNSMLPPNI